MSLERDLLAAYETEKALHAENTRLRDELAATRRDSAAALLAAQEAAKKTSEPPPSAPAAPIFAAPGMPPSEVPRTFREWVELPSAVKTQLQTAYPNLKGDLEAEHAARLAGNRSFIATVSGPDLRRGWETEERLRQTVRRAFEGEPANYSTVNGRRVQPPSQPFIAPAPASARKSAVSTAKR